MGETMRQRYKLALLKLLASGINPDGHKQYLETTAKHFGQVADAMLAEDAAFAAREATTEGKPLYEIRAMPDGTWLYLNGSRYAGVPRLESYLKDTEIAEKALAQSARAAACRRRRVLGQAKVGTTTSTVGHRCTTRQADGSRIVLENGGGRTPVNLGRRLQTLRPTNSKRPPPSLRPKKKARQKHRNTSRRAKRQNSNCWLRGGEN